jgi:prolyl 4-hydroxylase
MQSSKGMLMNIQPDHLSEFMVRATSGVSKPGLSREAKEFYGWSDEQINHVIGLCSFRAEPKHIDYPFFYDRGLEDRAITFPFPRTQVYIKENFLSENECQALMEEIDQRLVPSTVSDSKDMGTVSEYRTSSSADLNRFDNELFSDLDIKITNFMDLDPFLGEAVQGQKYEKGQHFKEHWDFFDRWAPHYKCYCEWMGQRTWTTMIYLNDVEKGGETVFRHLKLKVKPKQGTLLTWNNLYKNGRVNRKTLHEALPPESGEKYIVTKWWRSWPLV